MLLFTFKSKMLDLADTDISAPTSDMILYLSHCLCFYPASLVDLSHHTYGTWNEALIKNPIRRTCQSKGHLDVKMSVFDGDTQQYIKESKCHFMTEKWYYYSTNTRLYLNYKRQIEKRMNFDGRSQACSRQYKVQVMKNINQVC